MNIDKQKYNFYKELDPFIYDEMFNWNVYGLSEEEIKGQNVLDIGGHFGSFSNVCNDLGAKKIVAVEANPLNYLKYLKYTQDIPGVKCINAAVTSKYGGLVTIDDHGGESMIGKGNMTVATITLKDAVEVFPSNEDIFLKMDIEGAEYEVIYGTPVDILRRFNIIAMEMHEFPNSNNKFKDLDTFIQSRGFAQIMHGTFFTEHADGSKNNNDIIGIYKYRRI